MILLPDKKQECSNLFWLSHNNEPKQQKSLFLIRRLQIYYELH